MRYRARPGAIAASIAPAELLGLPSVASLAEVHAQWVAAALRPPPRGRMPQWTESLAVGAREFVERVGKELGQGARYRQIATFEHGFFLHEPTGAYGAHWPAEMVE